MYLSRLVLNTRSRSVRRDLADCYALHRTIMSLFGPTSGERPRVELGVLYRVETALRSGETSLLVQSAAPPDFSGLRPDYLANGRDGAVTKDVTQAYASLAVGARYRFRLRANATKRLAATGRRVEIVGDENLVQWLRRKGDAGGFEIAAVAIAPGVAEATAAPEPKLNGRKPSVKDALVFGSALFDGALIVRDPAGFGTTLRKGIGSGKAFGFGLLSLGPAASP